MDVKQRIDKLTVLFQQISDGKLTKSLDIAIVLWPLIYLVSNIVNFPIAILCFVYLFFLIVDISTKRDKKLLVLLITVNSLVFLTQIIVIIQNNNSPVFSIREWLRYYIKWVTFINYILIMSFTDMRSRLQKFRHIISFQLMNVFSIFITVIYLVMYITGNGIMTVGSEIRFKGIFYNAHVNAYFLSSLMTYLVFYLTSFKITYKSEQLKNIILINTIPMFLSFLLVLMTGARTPFAVACLLLLVYAYHFLEVHKHNHFKIYATIVIIICASAMLLLQYFNIINVAIIEKMLRIVTNPSKFLNSRDIITKNSFKFVDKNFKLTNWLFGYGFGSSIGINLLSISKPLWSHNDFLEIFISAGFLGLIAHLYVLFINYIKTRSFMFTGLIIFVSLFNGLFIYQEIVIYLPILSIVFSKKERILI